MPTADAKIIPKVVDDVARLIIRNSIGVLLLAGVLIFLSVVYLSKSSSVSSENLTGVLGAAFLLQTYALFLIVLAQDFRNLRSWTYVIVDFMVSWGQMSLMKRRFREELHEKVVRKSFGLEDEEKPDY